MGIPAGRQPKGNANASTPASRNSISNRRIDAEVRPSRDGPAAWGFHSTQGRGGHRGRLVRASTLAEDGAETLTLAKITHVPRQVATREATAPTDPRLVGQDH